MTATRPRHEDKILLVLTLIIGAVVGAVVVAFILLTENLGSRLYPAGGAAWRRVLIPFAGALGTGFFLYRYFPNARGSGIPQTKTALFLRDGYITFRTVLGKFGLCSVSLASGVALGREGPSVHVGAGIASVLGRRLGLSPAGVKALLPTGAAAALAAAFNTPISAVLFSLEEVMGDMHAPVLGSIVLASATSWIVLHLILGDEPLFHVPAYQLVHPIEFLVYAVLGVIGGLVSVTFVKVLLWQRARFMRAPKWSQWFLPGVGGLTVGLLGWFFPDVLGVGYGVVGKALNGQMVIGAMALLVFLKLLATCTCYASGNAGGIFGPSLFIGAMMGGAVGGAAHMLMPDYTGSAGAYALVGMGAAFAGIVRVPLTSVIMVFEITRDYSIIVPLMIANLISYFISSQMQEEPIYEALQHQDGIHLPPPSRAREDFLMVGQGALADAHQLSASVTAGQARAAVDGERSAYAVTGESGFIGMVPLERLKAAAPDARVATLVDPDYPHVYPEDPLEDAMRLLAAGRLKVLPVVSSTNARELKGIITLEDILKAYAAGKSSSQPVSEETKPAGIPNRLMAGALAAFVAVAILGGFLNYYYRAERGRRAEQTFQEGNELLQQDRIPEAIERYRNALSLSHSLNHRLALGLALEKAGRLDEAAIYLDEVVRQQPNSGPANLALATIAAQKGQVEEAVLRYQRAIVGAWPNQPAENRFDARRQFVEFLAKAGRRAQARAEILAMVASLPPNAALQKQAGQMLLAYGLNKEAVDFFGSLLRHGPPDATEFESLGQAEFAVGNYRAAAAAFRKALEIDPASATAERLLPVSERILELDPTHRGLRGSQDLLDAVTEAAQQCAPAAVPRKKRTAEENLALAEEIWANRLRTCPAPSAEDPLALVMAMLAAR